MAKLIELHDLGLLIVTNKDLFKLISKKPNYFECSKDLAIKKFRINPTDSSLLVAKH